ncbi:Cilia- and flagella-associated protein 74 [Acanthosepion pharaonis]|uniref:Cilia- and flagella-associated protein 74 n=1 Tax=Acanthosepion pharaonis TaxID=158019 RepID=A0A812CSW1_ACAPH|nr:Cilia- and flagella-associated protein 74 [Sepia pharaonis]
MYDRLYQETVILFNRETSALKIRFEMAKEMRNHLEILPNIGYIQARSQFQAQLKFLPRKSLAEDAPKYFDPETCVLEAPIIIWVAKHNKAVEFAVHAVVTTSDLQFSVQTIDFGHCTIHESVRSCIQLINKSLLPQDFGFVDLPPYVSVQPNDGFGIILPLETLNLDVLFQPHAAKEYNFQLVCKTLINRNFCLQGKGIGVRPPLELSHQKIIFKETALYDESEAVIYVVSSLTYEQKEINALFRRTGKNEAAPVGHASFEFVVPQGVPIKISPAVGTVEPEKSYFLFFFSPLSVVHCDMLNIRNLFFLKLFLFGSIICPHDDDDVKKDERKL